MLPKIISIVGPTASGKTARGIEIAKKFNGEVIAVDSRTVYREMDVGTAKPSGRINDGGGFDVDGVTHWGLDLVEPDEEYTVTMFQKFAREKITEVVSRGYLPVLVGGTALWMDAVVDNLAFPEVPPQKDLRAELEARSVESLAEEYEKLDPDGAQEIDLRNKRRLIRAIEVCRVSGKPFSELKQRGERLYEALWLGVSVLQEILDERIGRRVDQMMADGLLDEVKKLKLKYGCDIPSMSGIGYKEICEHLNGGVSLEQAVENIKTNTRRFARRQMTWWKRREGIAWVENCETAVNLVSGFLPSSL